MTRLRHYQAGDPIPTSAAVYNAFVDAAIAHRSMQNRLTGGAQFEAAPLDVVVVKNNTGVVLGRGSIVGLDAVVITPAQNLTAFRQQPVVYAEKPATPTHYERWAVLAEPLRKAAVGWAFVSGVHAVQVNFAYEDEPFATIANDDLAKLAGAEGGARVLWKESGTGTKWALVRLGAFHWPKLFGKLDGDLTQATGYATMSIWEGSTLADSNRNVTVYDWFLASGKKIASGAKVAAEWKSGKWYVDTTGTCPS